MYFIRLFSKLPFFILYAIADFLFFITYYVIGYRKQVVFENLKQSFPDKKDAELRKIAKGFYRNLADVIVETIKLLTISPERLKKRVLLENREVIQHFYNQKQSVIVLTSHQCNWEWLLVSCSQQLDHAVDAVYLRLNNAFSEKLLKTIRSRFGARLIEKRHLLRELLLTKDITKIIAMVGDQAPMNEANVLWTNFLNQETNFFTGSERLAFKLKLPVLYVEMKRQRRGFYIINFKVLAEAPSGMAPNEITKKFVSEMETSIRKNPSDWLWSHRRWKYAYKRKAANETAAYSNKL